MRRKQIISLAAGAAVVALCGPMVPSVRAGTAYTWSSLTGGNWTDTTKWTPSNVPGVGDSANLNVATTGNLLINLPATTPQSDPNLLPTGGQSIGSLTLGSTSGAFTTDIGNNNNSGGFLTLDNTGGATTTDSYTTTDFNPTITSLGAAGSTNIISAALKLTGTSNTVTSTAQIAAASTNSLSLTGGIVIDNNTTQTNANPPDQNVTSGVTRVLQVNLTGSNVLNVGNVTSGFSVIPVGTPTNPTTPLTANINNTLQFTSRNDPTNPTTPVSLFLGAVTQFANASYGTVNMNGTISDGNSVTSVASGVKYNSKTSIAYGLSVNLTQQNSLTTFVISGNNTYSGGTTINRSQLIIASDTAFGTGGISIGNSPDTLAMGQDIASTDDARTISNPFNMSQNLTVNGSHSFTWNGSWLQSNDRVLENLLPAGKTLTLTGAIATPTSVNFVPTIEPKYAIAISNENSNDHVLSFDGPGTTIVSGRVVGSYVGNNSNTITSTGGQVSKGGDGLLIFSNNDTSAPNFYGLYTAVSGGTMEFTSTSAIGISNAIFANPGGAVGLDTGSLALVGASGLINSTQGVASTGSLALSGIGGSADPTTNIDYTGSGNMSGAFASGMSIGALPGGVTYTGTITPSATLGYRLGGGSTLTLPNTNALTGARNLTATNGGTVALTSTNNYTGTTTVRGNYIVSTEQAAAVNNGQTGISGIQNFYIPTGVLQPTTLAINSIADGNSSIGNPTDITAANLVLNGGILKITGSGGTTSRLFTIGSLGGTLDSSGGSPVVFSNPGSIVSSDVTSTALGLTVSSGGSNKISSVVDASGITAGMIVTGTQIQPGAVITGVQANLDANATAGTPQVENYNLYMSKGGDKTVITSKGSATHGVLNTNTGQSVANAPNVMTFFNQNRTLTLSGTNSAANTISGVLSDSPTGSLGVTKSNTGTWVLGGANNYSGNVNVNGGTLAITNPTSLGFGGVTRSGQAVGTTTVSSGTLDLGGQTVTEPLVLSGGTLGNSSNSAAGLGTGVAGISISNPGINLSTGSTVTFTGSNTTPATANLLLGISTATTTSPTAPDGTIRISTTGTGYNKGDILNVLGGGGTGAQIEVTTVASGHITGYITVNPGTGYNPSVTPFTGLDDITADADAIAYSGATISDVTDGFYVASGIAITNPGSGYTAAPTIGLSSGTFTATAAIPTVTLSAGTTSGMGGSNGDISIPLKVSGSGSLTKVGANTVTLGSSNNFAGNVTVSQGNLKMGNVNSLGIFGPTPVGQAVGTTTATGGTIDLNGQTNAIEPIVLNGGTLGNSNAATASLGSGVAGFAVNSGSNLPFSLGSPTALTGGGGTGATGSISLGMTAGTITLANNSGNYTAGDVLTVVGGGPGGSNTGATITVLSVNTSTQITSWQLTNPGSGFVSLPTGVLDQNQLLGPVGPTVTGHDGTFVPISATLNTTGSGYTSAPTLTPPSGTLSTTPVISGVSLLSQSGIGGSNGDIVVPLAVTGAGGLNKVGSDTVTLSAVNGYNGPTNVNQGTLLLPTTGSINNSAVTVGSATPGTLNLAAPTSGGILVRNLLSLNVTNGSANVLATTSGHANRTLLITPSVTVGAAGKLDLSNNDMIVQSTSASSVFNQLKAGFNVHVSYENGNGIISSSAAADTRFLTTLGYHVGGASFDPVTPGSPFDGVNTTSADILVKYTYFGDATLDGKVDGADYTQIDTGFGMHLTGWSNGDFNYDGIVDGTDYSLIDNTFNQYRATGATQLAIVASPANLTAGLASTSAVPEPTTLGLLGIGAAGLLARRRRRVN